MFLFPPAGLEAARAALAAYARGPLVYGDSLWEEYLLGSRIFAIEEDGLALGALGMHPQGGLSFFYMPYGDARPAFRRALEVFRPRRLYARAGDRDMMALCQEHGQAQECALFYRLGQGQPRPPAFGRECFNAATPQDVPDIAQGQDTQEQLCLNGLFVLRQGGEYLGQGFLKRHGLQPATASIGMAVSPEHRGRGAGRSIALHLLALCQERGLEPVCACRPDNAASRAALQSAGFQVEERLLSFSLEG